MINTIGEYTVQQTARVHQGTTVVDKEAVVQKSMQTSVPRPVEKSNDSRHSHMNQKDEEKSETTTRHRIEDDQVILERYDQRGKLVEKVPPGYVPFGEIA